GSRPRTPRCCAASSRAPPDPMTAGPGRWPLQGGDAIPTAFGSDGILLMALGAAALAILLAWPVPILLSRAAWPARLPGWALVLWQLIAVAGGLSMIAALLLLGAALFPAQEWIAIVLAGALAAYLLVHL